MAVKHYDARTFTCSASLGYLLKISHQLMHDCASAAFAPYDLSFIQWLVLMKIKEGKAVIASDVCKSMHYDNGSATRLLDQLEERGLLRRERSTSDRRAIMLKLTPSGEKKLTELIAVMVDASNEALGDLSKAEFAQLTRSLNKLIASLRARQSGSSQSAP